VHLLTYLLTYLLTKLAWAYEAGNISETVEHRAIHWLLITAKMYDFE